MSFLNRTLLAACAATAASAAAAQPPAPPPPLLPTIRRAPPIATPPPSVRQFPIVEAEGLWALPRPGRIIGGPDWSNYEIYPRAALVQDQEGAVRIAVQVAPDGRARACAILVSSGFVELDDGTCTLAMTMRFEPRLDDQGHQVDSTYRNRITWVLSDQFTLAPGRLTVALDVVDGHAANCRTGVEGRVEPTWLRTGCRMVGGDLHYFLGQAFGSARHATVAVTLRPPGDATHWLAPSGILVASRRTEFGLNAAGDPTDCRTPTESGFGPHGFDYSGPCGLFLTQSWLRPAAGQGETDRAAVEIETYVER